MPAPRPRSRLGPQLWLGLFSLLGILGLALVDVQRTAPGPVTTVHARISDLAGGSNCKACHGGWSRSMGAACLECHAEIEAQRSEGVGLHGSLSAARDQRCADCHAEHHGVGFELVSRTSFAIAGVPDPEAFDHTTIGWEMLGKHLEQTCDACHTDAYSQPLPEGAKRYLGISPACIGCHEDQHEGLHGDDCAACHVQTGFEQPAYVGHAEFLPLVGGHAQVACAVCHPGGDGEHSLAALRAPGFHGDGRDCAACHASPHGATFSAETAAQLKQPAGSACVACHLPEHTQWRAAEALLSVAQHRSSGFSLDGPHGGLSCDHCHADPGQAVSVKRQGRRARGDFGLDAEGLAALAQRRGPAPAALPRSDVAAFGAALDFAPYAARFPGRAADACAACHADPHAGQFEAALAGAGPYPQSGCLACHARESFAAAAFDQEHHRLTALPLDGRHGELDCAACHPEASGQPALTPSRPGVLPPTPAAARARWSALSSAAVPVWHSGLDASCAACHVDAHQSYFSAHAADATLAADGNCAACHTAESFSKLKPKTFDHNRHTRLLLDGAHAEADCEACHAPQAELDNFGRRFGTIAGRYGNFVGCQTCHTDPHGGAFARWNSATESAPLGTDCAACHSAASFRHDAARFDHGAATGYALTGAHARAACSSCHASARESAQAARQRPGPENPLAALGLLPSAAPQREAHTPPRSLAGARGQACEDCHADAHARQFDSGSGGSVGSSACAACHSSTESFQELSFDHQQDSRFPLEGAHKLAACAACHKAEPALAEAQASAPPAPPGSARASFNPARYKPLGMNCTDCHGIQPGPLRRGG